MAGIEIREHCGDFDDLVELMHRVWIPQYRGRMWFSLPDARTLRSWAQGGGCVVAYQGTKIVGSIFSIPCSLRIASSVRTVPILTGLTVDPDCRRAALPLVERIRRLHAEREIAFGIGGLAVDRSSTSYRFWTRYSRTFPQRFHFLFRTGHWFKILAPGGMARASITAWERLASNTVGHLLSLTPQRHDPHVRRCRVADLERCAQMLEKASADFDWAMVCSVQQLTKEMEDPAFETLVFEREGHVQGMVRYRRFVTYGRQPVPAAVIDLWADDALTAAHRVRLLGHLCSHLRERDVHVVVALRSAMMPVSAFVANLFMPTSGLHVVALMTKPECAPLAPRTWSLPLT